MFHKSSLFTFLIAPTIVCFLTASHPAQANTQNQRTLGLLVNQTAKMDYKSSFETGKAAGLQSLTMSLAWDELEKWPEHYDGNMLAIANDFYPGQHVQVSLVVPTIDTNNLRLPGDLKGRALDDPLVIARFNKLTAWVFKQVPKLQVNCYVIGNEVDAYLGKNAERWNQYRKFFAAASAFARSLRPGLVVGCKTTFDGTVYNCPAEVSQLNASSDALMLTYYPFKRESFIAKNPDDIFADINLITALNQYKQKPIYILETGYPSSTASQGSEQKQATFITNMFKAWDIHQDRIKLIEFLWLNDLTDKELDYFAGYYHSSAAPMRHFLGSIGLRDSSGREKPALSAFRNAARLRGL